MGNQNEGQSASLGDAFDRTVRSLEGLPGVVKTGAATLRMIHPVLGVAQTFIVQTYRQSEEGSPSRDTILVEYMDAGGVIRIALPSKVADTISRQRDALTTKNRKRAGLRRRKG